MRGNEQSPRITLYCRDDEQKEKIVNGLHNLMIKIDAKKIIDAVEYLVCTGAELEQQKSELIAKLEFIKDFGYKNSGCGFSCAKIADETLKKYSGE